MLSPLHGTCDLLLGVSGKGQDGEKCAVAWFVFSSQGRHRATASAVLQDVALWLIPALLQVFNLMRGWTSFWRGYVRTNHFHGLSCLSPSFT